MLMFTALGSARWQQDTKPWSQSSSKSYGSSTGQISWSSAEESSHRRTMNSSIRAVSALYLVQEPGFLKLLSKLLTISKRAWRKYDKPYDEPKCTETPKITGLMGCKEQNTPERDW
ncbi:hypothetical protein ILYODFUR_004783 [Ilyodon furcidens]|uniref:Uncharacterized protein n=1 Tax=Ilyodon furcidens TaxID=33524 RepID=A0ABV0VB54_9TELE